MQHSRFQRWIAGITFFSYLFGLTMPTWATQALTQEELPKAPQDTKFRRGGPPLPKRSDRNASHRISLTIDQSQPGGSAFILDYDRMDGKNLTPKLTYHLSAFNLSSNVIEQSMRLHFEEL